MERLTVSIFLNPSIQIDNSQTPYLGWQVVTGIVDQQKWFTIF